MEVYHQIGFRSVWNLQSLQNDNTGSGLILSPRFQGPNDIAALPGNVVQSSIFDPQFFRPNTSLGKLSEYDFFPNAIAAGFNTSDYSETLATESARRCIQFQLQRDFRYLVIPTRYAAGMPTNFIQTQQELFVDPFLNVIAEAGSAKNVVLQLVLNENMIKDAEYSADILNWVTGIDALDGVYLIVEVNPRPKQIADGDLLFAMLTFTDALVENGLEVILGYLNTESILMSIASPTIVSIGIYENTRMFNIKNFEQKDDSTQQGPAARLYVSKLLQWISYQYIGAINRALGTSSGFFDQNNYQVQMFQPTYRWHFSKPELYKHGLLVLERQLRGFGALQGKQRCDAVRDAIRAAMNYYSTMEAGGVVFDRDSGGNHLPGWLTAANQFANQKGW